VLRKNEIWLPSVEACVECGFVPAHPVIPKLPCHHRPRQSVPPQSARPLPGTPSETSTFDLCYPDCYGSAVPVLRMAHGYCLSQNHISQMAPYCVSSFLEMEVGGKRSTASTKKLRELIRKMAYENPTWREERIANELKLNRISWWSSYRNALSRAGSRHLVYRTARSGLRRGSVLVSRLTSNSLPIRTRFTTHHIQENQLLGSPSTVPAPSFVLTPPTILKTVDSLHRSCVS
jgi:hypothetical protein